MPETRSSNHSTSKYFCFQLNMKRQKEPFNTASSKFLVAYHTSYFWNRVFEDSLKYTNCIASCHEKLMYFWSFLGRETSLILSFFPLPLLHLILSKVFYYDFLFLGCIADHDSYLSSLIVQRFFITSERF